MFKRLFSLSKKQTLRTYMEERVGNYQLSMADLAQPKNRSLVQSYCTSKCKVVNLLDDTAVAIVLGKYMMWVDLRDKALSPHLMLQGYWEMWITSAMARLTKPGTIGIDIGANLGYYTLLLADAVGPSGRVIAFEPNPRIANLLCATVGINGFSDRVTVREEAVGNLAGGRLTLGIPRAGPSNSSVLNSEDQKKGFKNTYGDQAQLVQVKSTTLDNLNLTNVGTVKIDAEGAEYDIWRGMKNTIDKNPDIQIFLEFSAFRSYEWQTFYHEMQDKFDKVCYVADDGQLKPLTLEMIKTQRVNGDWMIYLARG